MPMLSFEKDFDEWYRVVKAGGEPKFPYDQRLVSKEEFDSWSREQQVTFVCNYEHPMFIEGLEARKAVDRKIRGKSRLNRLKEKFIWLLGS